MLYSSLLISVWFLDSCIDLLKIAFFSEEFVAWTRLLLPQRFRRHASFIWLPTRLAYSFLIDIVLKVALSLKWELCLLRDLPGKLISEVEGYFVGFKKILFSRWQGRFSTDYKLVATTVWEVSKCELQ